MFLQFRVWSHTHAGGVCWMSYPVSVVTCAVLSNSPPSPPLSSKGGDEGYRFTDQSPSRVRGGLLELFRVPRAIARLIAETENPPPPGCVLSG